MNSFCLSRIKHQLNEGSWDIGMTYSPSETSFLVKLYFLSIFSASCVRLRATPASESGQTLPGLGTSGAGVHCTGRG